MTLGAAFATETENVPVPQLPPVSLTVTRTV